jgi:hypothetical protein
MIQLPIVEIQHDGAEKQHGTFDFAAMPNKGDRIEFGHSGVWDTFEVLWVSHRPLRATPTSRAEGLFNEGTQATTKVVVKWILEG